MRIVAGELKGRAVKSPSEETTRPTTDRVRESMFSAILSRTEDLSLDGACVLDAFAGSGALGFESLSRGARRAFFWEQDAEARKVLDANAKSLGLDSRRVVCKTGDVLEASQRPLSFGAPFDLVLLDPPYALLPAEVAAFVQRLYENGDLADGCIIVYEHDIKNKDQVAQAFTEARGIEITGQKKYGKVGVTYLEAYVGETSSEARDYE